MHQCPCLTVVSVAQSTKDFIKGMGLGMIADQLADLKLGELLDTPPPGLDEAVAIAKEGTCPAPEIASACRPSWMPWIVSSRYAWNGSFEAFLKAKKRQSLVRSWSRCIAP